MAYMRNKKSASKRATIVLIEYIFKLKSHNEVTFSPVQ